MTTRIDWDSVSMRQQPIETQKKPWHIYWSTYLDMTVPKPYVKIYLANPNLVGGNQLLNSIMNS